MATTPIPISTLPAAAPLTGAEIFPVVQSSATVKAQTAALPYQGPGTGAVLRTMYSKVGDVVSVKDFGAVGDGVADDRAAIQAAIDYVGATQIGGQVFLPTGVYSISGPVFVNYNAVTINGAGPGGSGYGVGPTDSATSLIIYPTTTNGIEVNADFACTISNIVMRPGGAATAGAAIIFNGATPTSINAYSMVSYCTIQGAWDAISIGPHAAVCGITNCNILDFAHYGIFNADTLAPDSGDSFVTGCFMITSVPTATHIKVESAGGLRVSNCKMLGGGFGIDLTLAPLVVTSILAVTNTSIENFAYFGILLNGDATNEFRYVSINGCEFSGGAGSQAAIAFADGFPVVGVSIVGNSFGCTSSGLGVLAYATEGLSINGNTFYGTPGVDAINIGAGCKITTINGNTFKGWNRNVVMGSTSSQNIVESNMSDKAPQSLASTSPLNLPDDGSFFTITGTTGFSAVNYVNQSGRRVTLKFAGALTVTAGATLRLASTFTTTANDTLTLVCDGTAWVEVSRSVNT